MEVNHEQRAAKAWPVLTAAAKAGKTVTYGQLAKAIGMSHHRPLRYVLGELQDYCLEEKLPPLTILVVRGSGTGAPGTGFIAWDTDSLEEGMARVFAEPWDQRPNPFGYAMNGDSIDGIIDGLLEDPEAAEDIYQQVKVRGIGQRIFRGLLYEAYNGKCAFCGLSFRHALDAAHIWPWAKASPGDRLNVRNGLLLCSVHHRMFDEQYFELTDDYIIEYCDPHMKLHAPYGAADEAASVTLHLERIILPENKEWWPSPELIARRREWFKSPDS